MARKPTPYTGELHYPEDTPDGPWGVASVGDMWAVINKTNSRRALIGPVVGITKSRPLSANYFDWAVREAKYRNRQHLQESELENRRNLR